MSQSTLITARLARRHALATAGAVATALALGGRAEAEETTGFPSHPRWKLVFVNHASTNAFFLPTQYGIQDACAMLDCDYQWTGSANVDVGEMVNALNAAIAGKAHAIAVPIIDPHAFNKPIRRALDAGIPVFAYNADAPTGSGNDRLAYIGQDLRRAGELMGERIARLVDHGNVALFISTPGQLNIQPRLDGAIDSIRKSGKDIQIETIATGATANEELSKIKAYYLGHQHVNGMFAVDGTSTQGVAETMKQYGLVAKGVRGGGFDLLPRTLDLINDGHLDFTIDQQPYLQGFYTALEMVTTLAAGTLVGPADINTGLKFVTKGSVTPYLATKTRFEGKSETRQLITMPATL